MKIIIYTLNYAPELTGIGKYSGEMTSWLSEAGHEIKVVAAPPYYPDWNVSEGYSSTCYRREKLRNITVVRCPLWVPNRPSGLRRIIHLATFALTSFPVMLSQVFWRPDVVWVVAPAFFCTPVAWLTARLSGSLVWLHVQDFEADAAFDLGLLKGNWIKKIVLAVERFILRRLDVVSTISERMMDRASLKGVRADRLVFFPNWVDISSISPSLAGGGYRAELCIASDDVVALYSGNMGNKQGLEILAAAAILLASNLKLRFVFCGNGAGRAELEELCKGLQNVTFLDLQPMERLGDLLTCADIHLLPQRAGAADLVMPSKLTGMLASGRPIVVTAHPGTELARVVEGRGLVVEPEQASFFADAIATLAADTELRTQFGFAARRYAEENLDRDSVLGRFEASLLRFAEMARIAD